MATVGQLETGEVELSPLNGSSPLSDPSERRQDAAAGAEVAPDVLIAPQPTPADGGAQESVSDSRLWMAATFVVALMWAINPVCTRALYLRTNPPTPIIVGTVQTTIATGICEIAHLLSLNWHVVRQLFGLPERREMDEATSGQDLSAQAASPQGEGGHLAGLAVPRGATFRCCRWKEIGRVALPQQPNVSPTLALFPCHPYFTSIEGSSITRLFLNGYRFTWFPKSTCPVQFQAK
jgi:hypothetical protein